jgi:hypothetical protein
MSINSSTDIGNLALDLLSAGNVQDIENPSSPTEELLARWYPQSRRKLLREHPWNFATKRLILSADSVDPAFGYSKAFSVPSDFIRVLSLGTNLSIDKETLLPKDAYQFEGGKILLNEYYGDPTSVRLIYIYDNKTVSSFDPMFVDLLAYELALSIAYKVTETNTNIQRIQQLQKERSAMAKAIDGQERPPSRVQRSRALTARRRAGATHRTDRIIF